MEKLLKKNYNPLKCSTWILPRKTKRKIFVFPYLFENPFTLFSTIKWSFICYLQINNLIFPNYRIIELLKNKNNHLMIDNKILMFVYFFRLKTMGD